MKSSDGFSFPGWGQQWAREQPCPGLQECEECGLNHTVSQNNENKVKYKNKYKDRGED